VNLVRFLQQLINGQVVTCALQYSLSLRIPLSSHT